MQKIGIEKSLGNLHETRKKGKLTRCDTLRLILIER